MTMKWIKYHGKFYWTGRSWIKTVPRDAEPGVKGIDRTVRARALPSSDSQIQPRVQIRQTHGSEAGARLTWEVRLLVRVLTLSDGGGKGQIQHRGCWAGLKSCWEVLCRMGYQTTGSMDRHWHGLGWAGAWNFCEFIVLGLTASLGSWTRVMGWPMAPGWAGQSFKDY